MVRNMPAPNSNDALSIIVTVSQTRRRSLQPATASCIHQCVNTCHPSHTRSGSLWWLEAVPAQERQDQEGQKEVLRLTPAFETHLPSPVPPSLCSAAACSALILSYLSVTRPSRRPPAFLSLTTRPWKPNGLHAPLPGKQHGALTRSLSNTGITHVATGGRLGQSLENGDSTMLHSFIWRTAWVRSMEGPCHVPAV